MVANRKIHVVYDGRNDDLTFDQLFPADRLQGMGIAEGTQINANTLNQENVRMALAQHYDVGLGEFQDHHIEFASNGNIVVRPETTFGI
jgi:hypothetical protein